MTDTILNVILIGCGLYAVYCADTTWKAGRKEWAILFALVGLLDIVAAFFL